MEGFKIPSHDGLIVSRNSDGGWTFTLCFTQAAMERLRGTQAFGEFVAQFVALFTVSTGKEN